MKRLIIVAAALVAGPAAAATGPFFSLANTDFVVLLAFLLFVGILVYFKVPRRLMDMLDKRSDSIRSDLDEARALREEAQTLLASYERKQGEVQEQADRIVKQAREEAQVAAERAKEELGSTIERRLRGAEEQIESARTAAVREVRDRAIQVAVAAAADVLARQTGDAEARRMIDESIGTVSSRLN
ncbi:F0F1 ATP synthase subunit B [Roseitranquillus sediminis]|uniref:F0F1 ATP synthase subunit B n=1 Tax=Roseitranquillus sediminis TaxID=2809051 RepID=UPI001D0C7BA0|nr:F0F1 ATP synthase subunit B [Roseitranquillus sediminis]MBM9594187.1 F0F1 ATP synthase subunit B [Roseitranquillus sediminis]